MYGTGGNCLGLLTLTETDQCLSKHYRGIKCNKNYSIDYIAERYVSSTYLVFQTLAI